MITDAVVTFFVTILRPVVDLLPVGTLGLPSPASLGSNLSGLDSLVPVLLPLQIGAGMLAVLGVFLLVRVAQWLFEVIIP